MWQQLLQIKQIMKSPNQLQTLRNLIGNDPQLNGLLNQLESLSPEQQKQKLSEVMNQMGVSEGQLKSFLGYK